MFAPSYRNNSHRTRPLIAAAALCCIAAAGCMVGPNYTTPALPSSRLSSKRAVPTPSKR